MVEALLFDIGNVIIAFDFSKAAKRIEPLCDKSSDEILTLVSSLTGPLERGEITPHEFYESTTDLINYRGEQDFMARSFEDIFELNEAIVQFIHEQKTAGKALFLLSNTNGIHVPFFERTYRVFDQFGGRIYSHEVGVMKPDPKIYEIAKAKLSLDPSKTLYIDDLPDNCAAGREAGFRTIQYDRHHHEAFLAAAAEWL
ncbi:MAG: HAD family phosphatase [Verrucomicrobiales bacterium]|nr:HAD family phosphatase [Verrucomicrobiales bacterium]